MLIIFSFTMLPSAAVGWWFGSGGAWAMVYAAVTTAVIGALMLLANPARRQRGTAPEMDDITAREGFFIVVGTWMLCSFFGSLPFVFAQTFLEASASFQWLAWLLAIIDSIFESTSGLTTTGASVLSDFNQPHAIFFWRSTLHWLGGMGIIVLSLAILPIIGAGGMQLFKAEVPGPTKDRLKPRIADTAVTLSKVYILLTVLEIIALIFCGMEIFDAVCNTFATVSTGGFSPNALSIGGYNSAAIEWVVIVFMFLSGCNFAWHYRFLKGEGSVYFRSSEFTVFVLVIILATGMLTLAVNWGGIMTDWGEALRHAAFQAVTILTCTGFVSTNFETWPHLAAVLLIFMMFIGGCAGSTSGGLKVIRLILLTKLARRELGRLLYPTAVVVIKEDGEAVSERVLWAIIGFFVLLLLVIVLSTLILSAFGLDLVTSLSASISCFSNVGPGFGEVGAYDNFAGLPPLIKLWLSFLMIVGRLEIFSVLILFAPSFWRK